MLLLGINLHIYFLLLWNWWQVLCQSVVLFYMSVLVIKHLLPYTLYMGIMHELQERSKSLCVLLFKSSAGAGSLLVSGGSVD